MNTLILASASEGRRELFQRDFGSNFLCRPMDIAEEEFSCLPVQDRVRVLAEKKAEACSALYPQDFIFAFDTMVECKGKVLGKPSDINEARAMLHELSGERQSVWTGYAFTHGSAQESGAEEAALVLTLTPEEIEQYILRHPVTQYAGAYALQKSDTKAHLISGSYDTIVGASMEKARSFYKKFLSISGE